MTQYLKKLGFFKSTALAGTVCFMAYPFVKTETRFYHQDTEFNKKLLSRTNNYLKAYLPTFGVSGKVRQVLFNVLVCKDKKAPIVFERINVPLSDGGTVSIDWAHPEDNQHVLH